MSTADDTLALTVEEIRIKIEDYRTTIHALQAFVGFVTWDDANVTILPGSRSSLGRRMETSSLNKVAASTVVTPDAVIQRTPILGYVVEVKKSLPRNNDLWRRIVAQLLKYDDNLQGWWTYNEEIEKSCIVLLIEISRAADFKNYLQGLINANEVRFDRPFSIIEFTRAPEVKEFLFIRKYWGEIEDQSISDRLESGVKVPLEEVIATHGELKFYDSPPVTEYLMAILWQDVFNERKSEIEYDEEYKAWVFEVSIDELTKDLQRLFGSEGNVSRDVQFPKNEWIQEAMNGFVNLGYAKKQSDDGNYLVLFKKIAGDVIERFAKHRVPSQKMVEKEATQLRLFNK